MKLKMEKNDLIRQPVTRLALAIATSLDIDKEVENGTSAYLSS